MDEPPPDRPGPSRPPFEIAHAAMLVLAIVAIVGVLVGAAIVLRCVIWPAAVCKRDFGLHALFAELLVVLVALITWSRERGG